MSPPSLPPLQLLAKTNLAENYHHATLISFVRGAAAIEVVAAHLRAQLFPSLKSLEDPALWYQALAFFTGFAHQAVVVFFLLSGWLVGGSLLNKLGEPMIMASYAIDRVTRLWIVLVPAFLLSLLFAVLTEAVDAREVSFSADNPYSVSAFFGNLFGLQDLAVPRYGGNFALWSLANETWYYVLFPLVVLSFAGAAPLTRIAATLVTALVAVHLTLSIVLFFGIWLLGVAASRIRINASLPLRLLILAIFLAIAVYFRLAGSNDKLEPESFVQDLIFSVAFLTLLSSMQIPVNPASRMHQAAAAFGRHLAAFSFTLYVVHVPLLGMLRHLHFEGPAPQKLSPDQAGDLLVYALMLVLIVLFAYVFHLPFEAQTYRLRRLIKKRMLARRARQPASAHSNG